MSNFKKLLSAAALVAASGLACAQDRYALEVPNGLAFSEFRGYEGWQTISLSQNGGKIAVILGNPAMIDAYKAGVPGNGKPFSVGEQGSLDFHREARHYSASTHAAELRYSAADQCCPLT
ncbi:MAG: hypothetical protein P4L83_19720 [Nevskia sp.]|nr:hypothetical protein [Nevskia sp.]